jgi:hypothetical protein
MSMLDLARRIQRSIPVPKVAAPHEAFCIGVDLAADFAALCVLERLTVTTEEMKKRRTAFEPPAVISTKRKVHRLRCLYRLPSTYPEIIEIVKTLLASLPEAQMKPATALNVTTVGKPVAVLIAKAGIGTVAVTATSGEAEHRVAPGEYRVPRQDLISNLAVIMQSDRFRISPHLIEAEALASELSNFNAAGDDSWESHNLCRSVCFASWWCERMMPVPKIEFSMAR